MELRYDTFKLLNGDYSIEIHDFSKNSHIELICNDSELVELLYILETNGYQCGNLEE